MSRYTGAKARHCRRFGVNIYGSPKYDKILSKRNYPPGMHGLKKFRKKSEYAKQLEEKQKARLMYGMSEKQFKRYFEKANRSSGVTGDELLKLLERRIDNAIYRAGFAETRVQARQIANHGLITLNGKRVTIPSVLLKIGDKIEIRKKNAESPLFADIKKGIKKIKPPSWLKIDPKNLSIEVVSLPDKQHFERIIESQLIVEFYSK